MAKLLGVVLGLVLVAEGIRFRRKGRKSNKTSKSPVKATAVERVHSLITYGAARPGVGELQNPATGSCFEGYRFVMQNTWTVDPVPALGQTTSFAHPLGTSIKMHEKQTHDKFGCGTNGFNFGFPEFRLHESSVYIANLKNFDSVVGAVTLNGLAVSYEDDLDTVKSQLQPGWELQASMVLDGDKSHVIMHKDTQACIITFSGSDDASDWYSNAAVWPVKFCELEQDIHNGFRSEVMRVVNSDAYQQEFKPKLKECTEVTATGHSLGGAMAAIFSACANNELRAAQDSNFTVLKWW